MPDFFRGNSGIDYACDFRFDVVIRSVISSFVRVGVQSGKPVPGCFFRCIVDGSMSSLGGSICYWLLRVSVLFLNLFYKRVEHCPQVLILGVL